MHRTWILILSPLLLAPTPPVVALAETNLVEPGPRYLTRFSDGSYHRGDVLTDWHETDARPRLDDRELLDPENPLRWMWDRRQGTQAPPRAYLELWNGDRLPGSTLTYEPAREAVQPRRACWHVRPGMGLRPPHPATDTLVRVQARFVRRIVWRSRREWPYQPGTAVLRGGGRVAYRSIRLTPQAALLLLDNGTRRVAFADLDELHLPWQDPWPLLFAELGTLTPLGKTRLLQLETVDGLLATASMNRFAAYALGGSKYSDRWVHGIQPVWSQDILWIPCGNIRMRRMWDPDEQPLCRVWTEPQSKSPAASTWPPRVNENVQGSILRSGGQVFGWGFGVHAPEVLTFPLPGLPLRLSGRVGLDNLAGTGGCVQVRIHASQATDPAVTPVASGPAGDLPRSERGPRDDEGDLLFESPVMVGSEKLASFEAIRIPRVSGRSPRLRFTVDIAHAVRPSGADPFDIRDMVDWAEPVLRFEPTSLGPRVTNHAAREIAAWDGWTPHVPADAAWRSSLREAAGQPGEFQNAVALDNSPLSLIRRMHWTPEDAWLLLAISQDRAQKDRPLVTVYADGEPIHEQEVPFTDKWRYQVDPIIVPLRGRLGRAPQDPVVEVRLHPGQQPTPVTWSGISLEQQLPMIRDLLDEPADGDPSSAAIATAQWTDAAAYVGQHCLLLSADTPHRLPLEPPLRVREKPTWGEFRFLRFAFRLAAGGQLSVELTHRASLDRPARYYAGKTAPADPQTRRIWDREAEDQWVVLTRDLYADFGAVEVESLVFQSEGGGPLRLDHVVAGMMSGNLELAKPPEMGANPLAEADPADLETGFANAIQARVRIDFGDDQIGEGTIVDQQGHVLTAGHLVRSPGRSVQVTLPDGSVHLAKTGGVCREFDFGLIALPEDRNWQHADVDSTHQLDPREIYLSTAKAAENAASGDAPVRPVRIVGTGSLVAWSDFDAAAACGTPLLNRHGHVVGMAADRSRFGGLRFVPTRDIFEVLERLRREEVWGDWLPFVSPRLPFPVMADPQGCIVSGPPDSGAQPDSEAQPDGAPLPSGRAQAGDRVVRVADATILNPNDVDRALADRSPGDEVEVVLIRDGQELRVRVRLRPRRII